VLALDAAAGAWLLWEKLAHGQPLTERPMFFVAVMLFLAALFLVATGFVLELLSEAVTGIAGSRPYVVRERVGGA
jgi:hypothetical protein